MLNVCSEFHTKSVKFISSHLKKQIPQSKCNVHYSVLKVSYYACVSYICPIFKLRMHTSSSKESGFDL